RRSNRPGKQGPEPVKPATRHEQAINRQLTGSVAQRDLAVPCLPSRWLRIHPAAGGVSKPNGILRPEAGPVRNTQGTGAEQVLNRPSSHEPTGGTSKPLTPETERQSLTRMCSSSHAE